MSLILEALKKSEAERQRGKAPGLFVDQAVLPRRRRTGAPAWAYALSVLFAVVVAVFGWREWSRGDLAVVGTPPQSSAASAEVSAEVAAVGPLPPVGEGRSEGAPGATALPTTSAPPSPPPAPAREAASSAVADVSAPSQGAAPTPVVPQATTPSSASTAAPPVPPAGEVRGEGTPDASDIPMPTPTLPRLADLPASERNALPPMNVTMHVFADDPAQRFVILDGRRYGEGATPADGVVIREIRRDGLVLSLGGRDVLLPRP